MSFQNNFNTKKSEYDFKGTLGYENFNIFLKQPSLINYSIINTLTNYYNKFETTKILREISISTEDSDMQKFLDNTLKNLMYKTLFEKNIIRYMWIENISNTISFKLEKPRYDINVPYEYLNEVKINIENPLCAEFNDETGINLYHKNYREGDLEPCGLNTNIDSLWGQTIKIPELQVIENGHISNFVERTFTMPNPMETLREKILTKTETSPGNSYNLTLDNNEEVIIMLYYNWNNVYTRVASKYLSLDELSKFYNQSVIILESDRVAVVSSFICNPSFLFTVKYSNHNYNPNKKSLGITFLKNVEGVTSNYNAYGFKNFYIEIYGLTSE